MHACTQDPAKRHELDRAAVRELECALCGLRQDTGPACEGCGAAFGAYACLRCCFFDDDLRKQQFHCDACGICRVGGRANFFHCATCGCCYAATLEVRPRLADVAELISTLLSCIVLISDAHEIVAAR